MGKDSEILDLQVVMRRSAHKSLSVLMRMETSPNYVLHPKCRSANGGMFYNRLRKLILLSLKGR